MHLTMYMYRKSSLNVVSFSIFWLKDAVSKNLSTTLSEDFLCRDTHHTKCIPLEIHISGYILQQWYTHLSLCIPLLETVYTLVNGSVSENLSK